MGLPKRTKTWPTDRPHKMPIRLLPSRSNLDHWQRCDDSGRPRKRTWRKLLTWTRKMSNHKSRILHTRVNLLITSKMMTQWKKRFPIVWFRRYLRKGPWKNRRHHLWPRLFPRTTRSSRAIRRAKHSPFRKRKWWKIIPFLSRMRRIRWLCWTTKLTTPRMHQQPLLQSRQHRPPSWWHKTVTSRRPLSTKRKLKIMKPKTMSCKWARPCGSSVVDSPWHKEKWNIMVPSTLSPETIGSVFV